jgi:hypothetical protein
MFEWPKELPRSGEELALAANRRDTGRPGVCQLTRPLSTKISDDWPATVKIRDGLTRMPPSGCWLCWCGRMALPVCAPHELYY